MDLRIFILVLDLIAAFFAADFALAQHGGLTRLPAVGRVLARDALIHHQVSCRSGADVEMLVQPESLAGARQIRLPSCQSQRMRGSLPRWVST